MSKTQSRREGIRGEMIFPELLTNSHTGTGNRNGASCTTRRMSATRLKLEALLNPPFAFQCLPIEIKDKILKQLTIEDRRTARLVCTDWNAICEYHVQFIPILSGKTFNHVTTMNHKHYYQIIARTLINSSIRNSTFVNGAKIRKLTFEIYAISPENLKWLFTSCCNLEEIRIDFCGQPYRRFHQISSVLKTPKLPAAISLCQNLQKLDIYVGQRAFCFHAWHFDCGSLSSCGKLKYLNIRSLASFFLHNCDKLPTSLQRFNAIMLLEGAKFSMYNRALLALVDQLRSPFHISTMDRLSDQDLARVRSNFPVCFRHNIIPYDESEMKLFWDTIQDVKSELYKHNYMGNSRNITAIFSVSAPY